MASPMTHDAPEGHGFRQQSTKSSTLVYDVPASPSGESKSLEPKKSESSAVPEQGRRLVDRYLIPAAILVVTLWPWIFLLIIRAKGGINFPPKLAAYAVRYPQQFYSLLTHLSTLNKIAVLYLSGCAIESYGKSLLARHGRLSLLSVLLLLCLKTNVWLGPEVLDANRKRGPRKHNLPKKLKLVMLGVITVLAAPMAFLGTSVLISPANFERTVLLHGTELDFMSEDRECLEWLDVHKIGNVCGRREYAGMRYSTCLAGFQVFDALESGLRNVLFRMNTSQGAPSLRQPKGVLPQGPDGIRGFDTIQAPENPFANRIILRSEPRSGLLSLYTSYIPERRRTLSYDYTLQLQGLQSSIRCAYDTTSPIASLAPVPERSGMLVQYDGACDLAKGLEPVLDGVQNYVALNTSKTLSYWACKSSPRSNDSDPIHLIYLRGWADYEDSIGNITCTVSQMRPAIFSVEHEGSGYFTAEKVEEIDSASLTRIPYPHFVDHTLVGLGNVVREAQDLYSNLVAESVVTIGANSLHLPEGERHEGYLSLYEAMIEGVLEYEAMYSRLIYSTLPDPPPSCMRVVSGTASYMTLGWRRYGLLYGLVILPLTILNLATLVMYPITMRKWINQEEVPNPTDVRWLLAGTLDKTGQYVEIRRGEYLNVQRGEDAETESGPANDVETRSGKHVVTESGEDVNFGWIRSL